MVGLKAWPAQARSHCRVLARFSCCDAAVACGLPLRQQIGQLQWSSSSRVKPPLRSFPPLARSLPPTHTLFFAQPSPQLLVLFPLRHPACFLGRFLILILPRIPARIRISRALVQPPHPSLLWFLLAFRPPPRVFVFSPWLFLLVVRPRCPPPYPISVGVHLFGVRFRFHRLS